MRNLSSKDLFHLPAVRAAPHTPAPVPVKARRQRRQPKFNDVLAWTVGESFFALLPLRTRGETNVRSSEHWTDRKRRVDEHHTITAHAMRSCPVKPPALVTMIRLAPRRLDDDNCVSAMKNARDSVAKHFGVDDRHADVVRYAVDQGYAPEPLVFLWIRPMA